jgi:uncharacterized repeat protein (TIGR04076 family)
MYELKVSVSKVLGTCTAEPSMKRGDHFLVRDGDITIPEGGYVCLWALQSLLPVITPKEREIREHEDEDWMWRVHHVQCPDPKGRVVFKIERTGRLDKRAVEEERASRPAPPALPEPPALSAAPPRPAHNGNGSGVLRNLRVVVEQVKGTCTSHMQPGDCFLLRVGRLYIPAGRHFCLYALHAALPLLPAKQRSSHPGDWLAEDHQVICPDPAGNVVMRIEVDQ